MNEQIVSFIDGLKSDKQIASLDEAAIKQTVVMRMLFLLGWDIFNIDEVNSNYKAKNQAIDYVLRFEDRDRIFIVVTKMGKALNKNQQNLLEYAAKESVEFVVFTDGLLWWFYLTLDKKDLEQKNFCSLDFLNRKAEKIADQLDNFLAKKPLSKGKSVELAKNILEKRHQKLVKETIPAAWAKLLSEPPDALVNLLIETTEKICGHAAEKDAVLTFLTEDLHQSSSSNDRKAPEQAESKPEKKPVPKNEPKSEKEPDPPKEPAQEKEPEARKEQKPKKEPAQTYPEKSISSFTFMKKVYPVKTWSDMIVKLCEVLQSEHKKDLKSLLWHSIGSRYYFSKNMNELRFPEEIGSTGIFLQTNMKSNEAVEVADSIVSFFGYSKDDFAVSSENK